MSEKQNFYVDSSLLNTDEATGGISGSTSRALKQASECTDDFVKYLREQISEELPAMDNPQEIDFVAGGQLRHNVYIDSGFAKIFLAKGTQAELCDSVLNVAKPRIKIRLDNGTNATWQLLKNDFNKDEICIVIKSNEVGSYG